ncbi:hypothetical protein BJ166DRAFT_583997 [Pestalotiopsis sp. NC0098]|nr:hypothetical protein BJ166DRAFT_583997 [Pestalotiopsis sp. NC0098]
MAHIFSSAIVILSLAQSCLTFNLYPIVNSTKLTNALGISTDCLAALNQSLPDCDQTLFGMVGDFENFWWEDDNVTALCSGNCPSATSDWRLNVYDACYGEYISAYGKLIPATSIKMMYSRVTSTLLSDEDYSDYLVDQLQDVADTCSTKLRDFTVRAVATYDPAPLVALTPTTTAGSTPAATTCAGQTVSSGSGCDALSTKYGVATGDLQAITNSSACQVSAAVCLPPACVLQRLTGSQTWQVIKPSPSIESFNTERLTYSPTSALGTNKSYILPPPPLGTDANAGNQQRGGAGGVVTPVTTVSGTIKNPGSLGSSSAPSPTQDGLVKNCNNYASAKTGDTCFDFAKSNSLSPENFYAWNPVLGSNGAACSTKFWASEYYCIGTQVVPSTPPGPTQSGIVANCAKYSQAQSGDTCSVFASRNSISTAQLYSWNAVLGSTGQNCGTSLWANEWYCVGASAAAATTTSKPTSTSTTKSSTSVVAAPGPTQSGISPKCNKYAAAISGDTCTAFAARNGITTANLYAWNAVLGANGSQCASSFWASEYYCIGVGS